MGSCECLNNRETDFVDSVSKVIDFQAGELSGFSDNSHFIRTFGHLTGTSPGRYAKEYQSSDQILLNN